MGPLPAAATLTATRTALHRVAVHVLAKARHASTGRFGLRVTPGGFGTPAFGEDAEVVRIAGGLLVHESAGRSGASTTTMRLDGSSLSDLAAHVGVTFDGAFSVGADTLPIGDPDLVVRVDERSATVVGDWFDLGARALVAVVGRAGRDAAPTVAQLWPEHFDLGLDLAAAPDVRTNLGASPGDSFSPEPYLYVGPWSPERPGTASYWNAPFGAVLGYRDVAGQGDPLAAAIDFFLAGLDQLARRSP
jgi:hypothetical protein